MDWKAALPKFRKTLDSHLQTRGFVYKGQSQWERNLGKWRAGFSFEVYPRDSGRSRLLVVCPQLVRSEMLSPEKARQASAIGAMAGYVTYAVYSLTYPGDGGMPGSDLIEYLVGEPEELSVCAAEIIQSFESLWLPWFLERSSLDDTDAKAHRRIEMVSEKLDFVP